MTRSEAAERLRRVTDGELDVYDDDGTSRRIDQAIVCNLYLEEHPLDDDEAVTAEWLAEWLTELEGVDFIGQFFSGKFRPKLIFRCGTVQLPPDATCGDVRRICAGLHITPLDERVK